MPYLHLPRQAGPQYRRGNKPEGALRLNTLSGFAKGLSFYGVVNRRGITDYVTGKTYALPNAELKLNPHGNWCAEYDGASSDDLTLTALPITKSTVSIAHDCEIYSTGSSQTGIAINFTNDNLWYDWVFGTSEGRYNWATGSVTLADGNAEGTSANLVSGWTSNLTSFAWDAQGYRDGLPTTSDSNTTFMTEMANISSISLGGRASAVQQSSSRITFLAIWGGNYLQDAPHNFLARDRYQLLAPAIPQAYFFSAAASSGAIPFFNTQINRRKIGRML